MPRRTQPQPQPSNTTEDAVNKDTQGATEVAPEVKIKPASLKPVRRDALPHGATIETY
jgi:hypothetical protein